MKKIYLLILLLFCIGTLRSQSLLVEDFSSNTMPPAGWSIDNNPDNWLIGASNVAGGLAPECHFSYLPLFTGETHLISPMLNTTGMTVVNLIFKHRILHYQSSFVVGVATRSGSGTWNIVWDSTVSAASGPAFESSIMISNNDVGSADFQFSFFYLGNTDNTDGWYIDDILMMGVIDHDVSVNQIFNGNTYALNTLYSPKALVRNNGLNAETFNVLCEIKDQNGTTVHSNIQSVTALASGATTEVSFTDYTLATANSTYTLIFTTQLTGDMDPTNNSKTKVLNTLGSEVFFWEDFEGFNIPAMNWSIDSNAVNWKFSMTDNASGTAPELDFNWAPQFIGSSRMISPLLNTSGFSGLLLKFKHFISDYGGGYQVGVATRHGNGPWTSAWERNVTGGDIGPEEITIIIANNDIGAADFQFCFYFTGDSYQINDWFIDNVQLTVPFNHDVSVENITSPDHIAPGGSYIPAAVIKNWGLNTETFVVSCKIYDPAQALLSADNMTVNNLSTGSEITVNFNPYVMSVANTLYKVVIETTLSTDQNVVNNSQFLMVNTWTTSRDVVIIEIGTGTWCGFCPGAALGAEDMVNNGHQVGILEHHWGDDYENQFSLNRINLYGITGFPTAEFDGTLEFIGGDATLSMYPNYLPLYQERAQESTPVALEVYGDNTGGTNYDLIVKCHNVSVSSFTDLRLFVGVTESKIPEVWQSLSELNFVTRLIAPDTNGTLVDLNNNPDVNVNLSIMLDPTWVKSNCEIVAFLQDMGTKEIFNGFKVSFDSLISGIPSIDGNIFSVKAYPNPAVHQVNLEFSLDKPEPYTIEIYDGSGSKIKTLAHQTFKNGINTVTWNCDNESGNFVSQGTYFIRMHYGEFNKTLPVVISK